MYFPSNSDKSLPFIAEGTKMSFITFNILDRNLKKKHSSDLLSRNTSEKLWSDSERNGMLINEKPITVNLELVACFRICDTGY
jgi:hypothetical protein